MNTIQPFQVDSHFTSKTARKNTPETELNALQGTNLNHFTRINLYLNRENGNVFYCLSTYLRVLKNDLFIFTSEMRLYTVQLSIIKTRRRSSRAFLSPYFLFLKALEGLSNFELTKILVRITLFTCETFVR